MGFPSRAPDTCGVARRSDPAALLRERKRVDLIAPLRARLPGNVMHATGPRSAVTMMIAQLRAAT
jgi:hypothetical protein